MRESRRCACPECVLRRDRELRSALESKFEPAVTNPRLQFTEGLRAVASFYDTHDGAYYDGMPVSLNMYLPGAPELSSFSAVARALGCPTISFSDGVFSASRQFGPRVKIELFARESKRPESRGDVPRRFSLDWATNLSGQVSTKQVQGVPHL